MNRCTQIIFADRKHSQPVAIVRASAGLSAAGEGELSATRFTRLKRLRRQFNLEPGESADRGGQIAAANGRPADEATTASLSPAAQRRLLLLRKA
jgi:hypothetical protein